MTFLVTVTVTFPDTASSQVVRELEEFRSEKKQTGKMSQHARSGRGGDWEEDPPGKQRRQIHGGVTTHSMSQQRQGP